MTRPTCQRCPAILAHDNTDPDGLCSPCRATVTSCLPFAGSRSGGDSPAELAGPAPEGVNVLELAAGILLIHDALHPGERIDLRAVLTSYGVELDNIEAHNVAMKLGRRHGLIVHGTPLERGYRVEGWQYVERRFYDSVRRPARADIAAP